jgi:ComF family protein
LEQIPQNHNNNPDLITAFPYHHPTIKKAVVLLKYGGAYSLAGLLAKLLSEKLLENNVVAKNKWLLVPIPVSKQRQKKRGYNQAEKIARALAKLQPNYFTLASNLLIKIKDTPSQVSVKNRAARLQNLHGAFAVTDRKQIENQNMIIIDDVVTTGGTTNEAKRVLQQAGGGKVIVAAVAQG